MHFWQILFSINIVYYSIGKKKKLKKSMGSKKPALLGFCIIFLVVGVFGAFLFVAHKYTGAHSTTHNNVDPIHSLKAVQEFCHNTRYKETCVKSISAATNTTNTKKLIKVGFQVTIKEIKKALEKSAVLHRAAKDPATAEAFRACTTLLDDSVDDLRRTLDRLNSLDMNDLKKLVDDLKTWLTGAATYQQTCLDGFENTKGSSGDQMRKLLKVGSELTTDALGMVKQISRFLRTNKFPGLYRRLLGETEIHEGFSRRILHIANANAQTLEPNVTVAQDGSGNYTSINEALKEVLPKSKYPFIIYVKEGVYKEYVKITKKMWNVTLIGDGPDKTKITGNKSFKGGLGTFLTATVVVEGDHFTAKDIGFENSAGPEMHQAVALRVTADESIFHNCRMDGYQDTLYAHNHRQFYRDCTITGTIDFIFGNARAIFQNCTIAVRKPLPEQKMCMITAQGRFEEDQVSAFVLQNCRIIPGSGYPVQDDSYRAYLGRPWKNFSRTVVLDSDIDAIIHPDGWARWMEDQNIDTCWFAESGNRGSGANQASRVRWPGVKKMSEKRAKKFTPGRFFRGDDWIKGRGLPYDSDRLRLTS